jgi:EmrB/QacA subfamily drug resistance transporter
MEETKGISYKWLALVTVAIGSFMSSLDMTSCNVAFPRLTADFETEASVVLWVAVAYSLVSTALLLVIGRIGDLFGRKRVYVLGFALFTIGLILCSLSQSILQLILFRIIQGVGGGIILALTMAIVTAVFPGQERGKAMGILEAVASAGVLVGPVLSGFLLDTLGWRSIFYVRVPVGIIGMIIALLLLREQKTSDVSRAVDIWGAVTLFGGLSCLLLFFNLGGRVGFASPLALILISLGVILLILFLVQEKRTRQPVVDLSLFKNRPFAGGNISFCIMAFSLAAMIFLIPFYLIDGVGFSALESGLFIASASVMSLVIGPLAGWLSDKIGTGILRPIGIALICVSLIVFSHLGIESDAGDVVLAFIIFGIGIGIFNPTTQSSVMGSVPKERLGTAAAMMNTIRQIGNSTGMAVAGVIYASRQSFHLAQLARDNLDPQLLNRLSVVGGYQDTIVVATIICGIGVITTLAYLRKRREF